MRKLFFALATICSFGLFAISGFATINLTAGTCQIFPFYNFSNGSYFNQTVCGNETQINLVIRLNSTETSFTNSTIGLYVYANFTPQENCTITKNLTFGENYANYTPPCQVNFTAQQLLNNTTFTDTITPRENESFVYNKSINGVNLNLTISAYPICRVQIPEGFRLIEDLQLKTLENTSAQYSDLQNKTIDTSKSLVTATITLESLQNQHCNVSDTKLVKGWKKLNIDSQNNLKTFASLNGSVEYLQFGNIIKVSEEDVTRAATRADYMLKQYAKQDFASEVCVDKYYPQLQANLTDCSYKPTINVACVNKVDGLLELEKGASRSGMAKIMIWGGVIGFVILAGIYLKQRLLAHPPI